MAATRRKVIISCAVTGSVHTPSMSPYLPATPDEIARQAIDAAKAGAAVLHLHARDSADGSPTPLVVPIQLQKGGTYEIVIRLHIEGDD